MMPTMEINHQLFGAGLGLRREFANAEALERAPFSFDFLEVAPENWIKLGGRWGKRFQQLAELHPFVCHGLSLSLGGPMPFERSYLEDIKQFLNQHRILCYSEHLSYCGDHGQLYDLLPIPFTEEAVKYVAERIRFVQEFLERRLAIENVSYYAAPGQELSEREFVQAVLQEADCDLLLDVNNIYVNSINHGYDPVDFLKAMPAERVAYCHVAGHYNEAEDLKVDTHGADVIEPVWDLLKLAYQEFGVLPTLLERDFNIPPLEELFSEVSKIRELQRLTTKNKPNGATESTATIHAIAGAQ